MWDKQDYVHEIFELRLLHRRTGGGKKSTWLAETQEMQINQSRGAKLFLQNQTQDED